MSHEPPGSATRPRSAATAERVPRSGGPRSVVAAQGRQTAADPLKIDWPSFLGQHDMRFPKLPQGWREAPHFGNAMLGSMLYQAGNTIRLEIFRNDVQDHRDESFGWTAYSRPRLIIGYFSLTPVGTLTGCDWRKDLWNAEMTGTITTDRGAIKIHHFVHAEDMAIVTRLDPSPGEAGLAWTWHPHEAWTSRPGYPATPEEVDTYALRYGEQHRKTLKPLIPNPAGRLEQAGRVSVWIQELMAGGEYATAWSANPILHIATIAHDRTRARADIGRFLDMDWSQWLATHRAWWHAYYPRSFITIPDKPLEALYWQTIYRYGCNSRAGRFFVDTSGIWFQGGPWAYTTHDWNTQSAHWGLYAANRLEQGAEVVNRLHANQENLINAVEPPEWREDSAYLPLATVGDMRGTRGGDMRYFNLVGCLPWLLHNAWWQYRFSMDETILRDTLFPLLRRAVNFYVHLSYKGDDGRLHLSPTYSPETGVWKDCNFDLSLLKWGCHILLKSARRLGIDDPLAPRWREVVETLVDFPSDEKGYRLGSDETARDTHRHLSHLLMIYPLYLVNIEQPGTADILQRCCALAHHTASPERLEGPGALHAMVQTHAGPIATALGKGDLALAGLRLLQQELTPNGLWTCGGNPCIESTLSLVNNIQDMLIQSWSDPASDEPAPIRIFPAVPSDWTEVEFHDLRTEGAFLVSAKRTSGRTSWIRIRSLAGEPCVVRPGMSGPFTIQGTRQHSCEEIAPGTYRIDLRKDEEVMLVQ